MAPVSCFAKPVAKLKRSAKGLPLGECGRRGRRRAFWTSFSEGSRVLDAAGKNECGTISTSHTWLLSSICSEPGLGQALVATTSLCFPFRKKSKKKKKKRGWFFKTSLARPCKGSDGVHKSLGVMTVARQDPAERSADFLGLTSPFFPGIRIFLENHQKPWGNGDRFLKRTMAEKSGRGINP